MHPGYNSHTFFNDIALLVVDRKIKLGKYVNPICLPREGLLDEVMFF